MLECQVTNCQIGCVLSLPPTHKYLETRVKLQLVSGVSEKNENKYLPAMQGTLSYTIQAVIGPLTKRWLPSCEAGKQNDTRDWFAIHHVQDV